MNLSREAQEVTEPRAAPREFDRVVVLVSVVLLLLFAGSVALLWRVGVFDANTKASNAQILAAALGLVGVLVTASLTFIGVLLKHSIDARTLQQADETERRLNLETSIRAVELLTEEGKPATPTRQAGALFVLVNQNQFDFAWALLGHMWARREISSGAAVWVVNRLLLSGDQSAQWEAASLLSANVETLPNPAGNFDIPACLDLAWTNEWPSGVRDILLELGPSIFLTKALSDWNDDVLNSGLLQLDLVRRIDEMPRIRDGATLLLDAFLHARQMSAGSVVYAEEGLISVDQLTSEIKAQVPNIGPVATSVVALAERLRSEWGSSASSEDP